MNPRNSLFDAVGGDVVEVDGAGDRRSPRSSKSSMTGSALPLRNERRSGLSNAAGDGVVYPPPEPVPGSFDPDGNGGGAM